MRATVKPGSDFSIREFSSKSLQVHSCCRKVLLMPKSEKGFSDEAVALTKAVVNVADRLELSQRALAAVIGLSEPTISRMRKRAFVLERGNAKAFELAQLLVQLWVLIDHLVVGDELAARAWLVADNSELGGRPIDLIQTVRGLAEVIGYLRARSPT